MRNTTFILSIPYTAPNVTEFVHMALYAHFYGKVNESIALTISLQFYIIYPFRVKIALVRTFLWVIGRKNTYGNDVYTSNVFSHLQVNDSLQLSVPKQRFDLDLWSFIIFPAEF